MMGRQTPRQTVPVRWLLGASPCFDPLGMPHEDQSTTALKGFLQNLFKRAFKNKLDNLNKIENYLKRLKLIKISLVFLVMKIRAFFQKFKTK